MGYYPVWSSGRTIQQLLPKYKGAESKQLPPIKQNINPVHLEGGVYKLNCDQCASVYVGQTGCFFDRLAQHIGDTRQRRPHGALTAHYAEQHQFRGYQRGPSGHDCILEPMWIIKDQATRDMTETACIKVAHAVGNTLNKDWGPVTTGLTNEIARNFPQLQIQVQEGGAIPPLRAAPTSTRNAIISCEGATIPTRTLLSAGYNSSNQEQTSRHVLETNRLAVRQNSPAP